MDKFFNMEGLIYKSFNTKIFLVCLFFYSCFVNGQTQPKSIDAKFLDAKIILDGKLDEPEWKSADSGTNFWQYFPTDSLSANYQTSFKVVYSETTLYVAIRAESPDNNYVVSSLRRDFGGTTNDNVSLLFDTFNDGTNAFFFGVTPYGVQREGQISEVREVLYEGHASFYQMNNFGDLSKFRDLFADNIKKAFDAGVLIAGGTDAPAYPSLWAGETMHRELELFVMAGIPPLDAIKMCTYNASKILKDDDKYGSLQEGLMADIVLVNGSPWETISDTRNIQMVIVNGKILDRKKVLTSWK